MSDGSEPRKTKAETRPTIEELFPVDDAKDDNALSEVVDQLQRELVEERDARREERFKWVCALIFVFDVFTFKEMSTWSAPLMIGILQLLFVVAVGRNWGMDHIWTLTERLAEKWDGKFKGS
ncbi:hypothetical protein [Rhizobium sp. BK661]|uniref:hypothetical protein n=1 Tax=Rhizobium sp. BK661 TaxID=2586991 RepID=UPI0021673C9B|nr:hypothetical protein [Rhizobium sp. BK661]MCS3742002.1 hypothetical protein [Rhizobium sp. BK661]